MNKLVENNKCLNLDDRKEIKKMYKSGTSISDTQSYRPCGKHFTFDDRKEIKILDNTLMTWRDASEKEKEVKEIEVILKKIL